MGFLTVGPYGPLSGRTGNTVGRITKNGNVFAARPRKSTKPPTQKQLDVRSRFTLLAEFLGFLQELVNTGFAAYSSEMSPMNAALQYNYKKAITGVSPNFSLDLAKVMYSRGKRVTKALGSTISSAATAEITFAWEVTETTTAKKLDKATFVIYCAQQGEFVIVQDVATREDGTYTVQAPQIFVGEMVHCYMHFTSVNNEVSDSVHVAQVLVI